MRAADRVAIEELYARYCIALDTGDEEGWIETFTRDGEFFGRAPARGRDELAAYHRSRMAARAEEPFTNPQHWNGNLLLQGEPPEVQGFAYVMRIGTMRDDGSIRIVRMGAYRDLLRKVAGRWLFARRQVSFEPVTHAKLWIHP
jgi:hypothetical protein